MTEDPSILCRFHMISTGYQFNSDHTQMAVLMYNWLHSMAPASQYGINNCTGTVRPRQIVPVVTWDVTCSLRSTHWSTQKNKTQHPLSTDLVCGTCATPSPPCQREDRSTRPPTATSWCHRPELSLATGHSWWPAQKRGTACQSTSGHPKLSLHSRVAWRHISLNSHTACNDDSSDVSVMTPHLMLAPFVVTNAMLQHLTN